VNYRSINIPIFTKNKNKKVKTDYTTFDSKKPIVATSCFNFFN